MNECGKLRERESEKKEYARRRAWARLVDNTCLRLFSFGCLTAYLVRKYIYIQKSYGFIQVLVIFRYFKKQK